MRLITLELNAQRRSIGVRNSSLNFVRELLVVVVNTGHPGNATFEGLLTLQQTLRGASVAPRVTEHRQGPTMPGAFARGDSTFQQSFAKSHEYVPLPLALRVLYS
jgi:hypothetical protein